MELITVPFYRPSDGTRIFGEMLLLYFVPFLCALAFSGRQAKKDQIETIYRTLAHYWRFDHITVYSDSITHVNASLYGNKEAVSIRTPFTDNGHLVINDTAFVLLNGITNACFYSPIICKAGITLAFWIRSFTLEPRPYVRSISQQFQIARTLNGSIVVRIGTESYEVETKLNPFRWTHIIVSWQTTTGLRVYRNGWPKKTRQVSQSSDTSFRDLDNFSLALLGGASYDDVMIWEKPLAPNTIKKVFQSQLNAMSNITCSSGVTSLNVSWQHSRDVYEIINSYDLRLRREGSGKAVVPVTLPKTATYFLFTNLLPYMNYRIKIWTRTEKDGFRKTRVVRCRTKEGVPERVEHLKAIPKSSSTLHIRWTPPVRINGLLKGYILNVTSPSFHHEILVQGRHSLFVKRLKENSTYTVTVAAFTSAGLGPAVVRAVTTIPIPIITTRPRGLHAIAINWNAMHVTWKALHPDTEVYLYEIQLCSTIGCISRVTNRTSYNVRGLTQLTGYRVRVKGKNTRRSSPWAVKEKIVQTPDRDECQDRVHNCSSFASCRNIPGGFLCTCFPGYMGSGIVCTRFSSHSEDLCRHQTSRNISWPATYIGEHAQEPCPAGTSGIAMRLCGSRMGRASWDTPDLEDCVSLRFARLQARLSSEVLDASTASDIAGALARVTSPSRDQRMFGGDVKAAVRMMGTLGEKTKIDPQNTTEENKEKLANFTSSLVDVASNLLDAQTMESWQDIPKESQSAGATNLLDCLETVTLATASLSSSSYPIVKETTNVLLNMQSFKTGEMSGEMSYPSNDASSGDMGQISIPLDEIRLRDGKQDNSTQVSFVYCNNIGELLSPPKSENDESKEEEPKTSPGVLMFSTSPKTTWTFYQPVVIILTKPKHDENMEPVCVFWNSTRTPGFWSSEGCVVNATNVTHTVCHCYHLTSFAVLMQHMPDTYQIASAHVFALSIISYAGIGTSLLALLLALITFSTFTFLRSSRNFAHINLTVSLILAEVLFLVGIDKTQHPLPCRVVAILLHYLFLVMFCWMASEGIILYFMLVRVFPSGNNGPGKRLFFICSWGLPAILVGLAAGFYLKGYGNERYCWLSVYDGFIWSFLGPVLFISLVNLVFLSLTFKTMADRSAPRAADKQKSFRYWAKACGVLTCLLGTTWLLGLFFINNESVVMAYMFNIFNALQGLFIFIFHCVADERIRAEYHRIFCCRGSRRDYLRKKSAGTLTLVKLGSASNEMIKDKRIRPTSSEDKGTLVTNISQKSKSFGEQESSQHRHQTVFDSDSLLTINKTSEEHGTIDDTEELKIIVSEPARDDSATEDENPSEMVKADGWREHLTESLFYVSSLEDSRSSKELSRPVSEDASGLSLPRSNEYYSDGDYQGAVSVGYETDEDLEEVSDNGIGSHPTIQTDTGLLLKLGHCKICSNSAYNMVCVHGDPFLEELAYGSLESEEERIPRYLSVDDSTEGASSSSEIFHEKQRKTPRGRVSFDDAILAGYLMKEASIPRVKHRWTHTPMTEDSLSIDIPEFLSESASCDDRFLRSHDQGEERPDIQTIDDTLSQSVNDTAGKDGVGERCIPVPNECACQTVKPEEQEADTVEEDDRGSTDEFGDIEFTEPVPRCIQPIAPPEPIADVEQVFAELNTDKEPNTIREIVKPLQLCVFPHPEEPLKPIGLVSPTVLNLPSEPEDDTSLPNKPVQPVKLVEPIAPIAPGESIDLVLESEPEPKFETCEIESLNEEYHHVYIAEDKDTRKTAEKMSDGKFKSSLEVKIVSQVTKQTKDEQYVQSAEIENPPEATASDNIPANRPLDKPDNIPVIGLDTLRRSIPDIIPDNCPRYPRDRNGSNKSLSRRFFRRSNKSDPKRPSKAERKKTKEQRKQEQYERTKLRFPEAQIMMLTGCSESSLDTISDRGSVISDSGSIFGERESLIFSSLSPTQEVDWSENCTTDEDVAQAMAVPEKETPKVKRGLVKRLGRIFESKIKFRNRNINYNIDSMRDDDEAESTQPGTVRSLREIFEHPTGRE